MNTPTETTATLDSPVVPGNAEQAPPLAGRHIEVCDTTLRDGSHSVAHRFTLDDVRAISRALDAAGVDIIEVTHGDGLGGSSFNYGFGAESDIDLIAAARAEIKNARLAALLLPGIGTVESLLAAVDAGIDTVRVATHCTEADIAIQHIQEAKRLGLEVATFLMMSHMAGPNRLASEALIMRDAGADIIYVVDSAGAMLPHQITERVEAVVSALGGTARVGAHTHNNLGSAVPNALAGARAGASILDGSLHGFGAGAGNAATEVLAAALDRSGAETGVDTLALIDAAEDIVAARYPRALPQLDRSSLMLGYAGVYGSFLLHTRRAAERYGVPETDILLELGRRRVVGGQEDAIIDVAIELAAQAG